MGARLEQPLVNALETAAQDRDSGAGGELADEGLGERRAAGGHGEQRALGPSRQDMIDRRGEHVRAHHHPRPAAGRSVVDRAVLVGREVADLNRVERPDPLFERAAGKADTERARETSPGRGSGRSRTSSWPGPILDPKAGDSLKVAFIVGDQRQAERRGHGRQSAGRKMPRLNGRLAHMPGQRPHRMARLALREESLAVGCRALNLGCRLPRITSA